MRLRLLPLQAAAVVGLAACHGDLGPPEIVAAPVIPVLFRFVNGSNAQVRATIHAQVYDRVSDSTHRQSLTLLNLLNPGEEFTTLLGRSCHLGCVVRMGASIMQAGLATRSFVLAQDTVRLAADTLFVRFRWPQDTTLAVELPDPPVGTFPSWP